MGRRLAFGGSWRKYGRSPTNFGKSDLAGGALVEAGGRGSTGAPLGRGPCWDCLTWAGGFGQYPPGGAGF